MRTRLLSSLAVLLALTVSSHLHAQTKNISGTVTDARDGTPLQGVSVLSKGASSGTTTAADGSFHLTVNGKTRILEFSAVGFGTQEVPIGNGPVRVRLEAGTAAALGEIVVIGYGTAKKKDLTGSIATVTVKDFQQGSITSPEQLIAGKVAGVSITPGDGQPGSGSIIRVRGGASLNASNDPLVVIDGVPLSSVNLQGINPNDIESMSILKDAAATAIYGSRASNGVIIITTKRGKAGKAVINFAPQLSASYNPKEYPVLSAGQFRTLVKTNGSASQIALLGPASTDWQKQIYQTAITSDNNLSVAGSFANIPYRVSGEFLDQSGILKTDNVKREALTISLTPLLFDKHLKIDLNLHGSNTDSRTANKNAAIGNAVSFDPTQPVRSGKGAFGGYFEWTTNDTTPNSLANRNPLAQLEQYNAQNHALRSYGNIQFDYKLHFLPDLHANLNLGYDKAKYDGTTRVPAYAAQSYNAIPNLRGQNNQYYNNYSNKVLEFYLNYGKDLKSIASNINLIAGYGYYDNYNHYKTYPSLSAANDTIPGTVPNYPDSSKEVTLESWYGRLIYTFHDRYILMGSVRTDGSSRFGPKYRWGVFPSGAFTWKVNQEAFLRDVSWLSDLKVRLSYGVTGNQDGIPYYSYLNYYSLSGNTSLVNFGGNYTNFFTPSAYAADLKWEQTATSDVGLDFGFLNNRITGSVDYYYKKTRDLLATVFVPTLSNFGNQLTRNVGNMTDEGVDLNINAGIVRSKDLSWDIGFNVAYNKFTITNLTVSQDSLAKFVNYNVGGISGGTGNTIQAQSVGYSPSSFYVLQQAYGVKGKPVEGLYVDQNRDGIINQNDLIHYKSPFAPFTFGFSTSVSWKKWSLSTVLRANVGNYVYNNAASNLAVLRNVLNPVGFLQNSPSSILNTNFYNNQFFSSYYVENASFLKMDNLGIAYDAGFLSRKTARLRLSLNCQNVFTVTKYSGSDPEIYGGIDNVLYPRPRIITLGANLTF
ncbi:MAG TPA: SusC/RagA family TonB-linked outer membrane protein [Puia sp.]|nr:SusC/RagA family TonB-linked outer membrane protein [Puia sp.]